MIQEPTALLADYARRWNLTLLPSFSNLSCHYVAPVICADGTPAVLKAVVPNSESHTEVAALRCYNGRNCVRLLDADSENGVLLLERLLPGMTLTALADEANDEKATSIAASLMRGLWRPAPTEHNFPTVGDWGGGFQKLRQRFGGGCGPLPAALVDRAERLFAELLASSSEAVLLHGDLHHDNILSAQRQPWLAIDPKGVIGEPAYEVGALLRNLWQDRRAISDPARLTERRVHQLAEELNVDRARIRGWGIAQAVLSAWWCVEDDADCWQGAIAIAELLAAPEV